MEFHLLIETNTDRKIKTENRTICILLLIVQYLLSAPSTSYGFKAFCNASNDLDIP